ncbi:MAG: PAS domain-containing protein [Thermodesulfovibrionales bacterium]|nr:PAS domain-containing protein [Thermodesulfovibrionales bacterium]
MFDTEKTKEQLLLENSYLKQVISEWESKYRTLEQLARSTEERYLNITSAVSDYIFSVHIVDGNPVETVHGPACYAITGYTPKEFYENSYLWINMVYPEDRASVLDHVAKILSGKEVKPIEHRIIRKDGVIRWVRNTPVCQYDEQGRLKTYDGLIQDITDIKRAYETLKMSEEKFSKAFHSSPDAISIISIDDNLFIDVNKAFEKIFGYSREEVIGKTAKELNLWANPYDREAVIEEIMKTGKLSNREIKIKTKSGDIITVLVSAERIVMDDKECLLYVSRDITERIRIFYNLLNQKINLEENVKILRAKMDVIDDIFMWQFINSTFLEMQYLNINYAQEDDNLNDSLTNFIDKLNQLSDTNISVDLPDSLLIIKKETSPIVLATLFRIIELISSLTPINNTLSLSAYEDNGRVRFSVETAINKDLQNKKTFTSKLTKRSIDIYTYEYAFYLVSSKILNGYYYSFVKDERFSLHLGF